MHQPASAGRERPNKEGIKVPCELFDFVEAFVSVAKTFEIKDTLGPVFCLL